MKQTRQEKINNYTAKAARWLHEANLASEAGRLEKAEKLYAKSQFWHDKMVAEMEKPE